MNNMKMKYLFGSIGTAALLIAPSVNATIVGTGQLTIYAPGYAATGNEDGPYTITTTLDSSGVNLGTFETFCLGSQVTYYNGGSYAYQISTAVQPFATEGSGGLQYVALGTAYLYSQYRAGAIGDGSANNTFDDAMQEAIWKMQDQSFTANSAAAADLTSIMNYVAAGVGGTANEENETNGAFGVYALDLSSGSNPDKASEYAQPQLCLIPPSSQETPPASVPEPSTVVAGGLLVLPLAVSMIRVLRQSKNKRLV